MIDDGYRLVQNEYSKELKAWLCLRLHKITLHAPANAPPTADIGDLGAMRALSEIWRPGTAPIPEEPTVDCRLLRSIDAANLLGIVWASPIRVADVQRGAGAQLAAANPELPTEPKGIHPEQQCSVEREIPR